MISTSYNRKTEGTGGNINVETGTLVLNGGQILADSLAEKGTGGKIRVDTERTLTSQEQLNINTEGFLIPTYDLINIESNTINTIQAAAPLGRSGEVNVSRVELNIAGQLAKVDASLLDKRPISNDPCNIARGVATSSFIEEGNGGLPSNAADFVTPSLERYSVIPAAGSGNSEHHSHRLHCHPENQ